MSTVLEYHGFGDSRYGDYPFGVGEDVLLTLWAGRSVAPRTLVELEDGSTTRRFASVDVNTLAVFYEGRLVEEPVVRRRIVDVYWGPVEIQDVTVILANADGALTAAYLNDLRGRVLTIKRYDVYTGVIVTDWVGQVDQASLTGDATLEIQGTNLNLAIFDEEIPKTAITTAAHPLALDVGAVAPVIFGNVPKVWLPCVNDDVGTNSYDYKVFGTVTAAQLWRDGPNDTLHAIQSSEYTVSTAIYPGYTCFRFPLRQVNFQGGRHNLYGDIVGFPGPRNFARAVQRVLGDTLWALGQPTDTASFDAAAAALPTPYYCDGAFTEPRKVKDILRELLMVRGMRLAVNALGQWQITVDTPASGTALTIRDGAGPGERNLLGVSRRTRVSAGDRPKSFALKYRVDLIEDEFLFTQSRALATSGRELMEENRFVRDHETADRITDYLAKRQSHGQETIEDAELTLAARTLTEGQLVTFAYAPLGATGETYEVQALGKGLASIRATLAGWNATIYTYTAGTIPLDNVSGTFNDLSRTPPGPVTGLSKVAEGVRVLATGVEAWHTLQFTTPAANYAKARIDRKLTGTGVWQYGVATTMAAGTVQIQIDGLTPGILYDYQVVALSSLDIPSTGVVINLPAAPGDTTAPATPTGFGAFATLSGCEFYWTENAEADRHDYELEVRDAASGGGGLVWNSFIAARTYFLPRAGFTVGTTYHARVRARDHSGNWSPFTASVPFTIGTTDTPDVTPNAITSFAISAFADSTFADDNLWHSIGSLTLTITSAPNAIMNALALVVLLNKQTAERVLSCRFRDATDGITLYPISYKAFAGNTDQPGSRISFAPSIANGTNTPGNHVIHLEVSSNGTSGAQNFVGLLLAVWEARR